MFLPFLDGIRALSALFVFLHHAYYKQFAWEGSWLFDWGFEAVATFIVLSGFCLGLQIDRSRNFWAFIRRRSRRLLPPYYAALTVLCLLLLINALRHGIWLQIPIRELLPPLFLVRELYPDPTDWLTGTLPFWSVGIEYRLYWILPVFAVCYRHYGLAGLGLSAIGFYLLATAILTMLGLGSGRVWLLFGFVFGIASAQNIDRCLPTNVLVLGLSTLCLFIKSSLPTKIEFELPLAISVLAFSAAIALLLQAMAHTVTQDKSSRAIDLLSHPWLGWLATWSYSLYLLHYGLLAYSGRWLGWQGITGWGAIALQTLPVLFGCWLFSQVFERPFLKPKPIAVS